MHNDSITASIMYTETHSFTSFHPLAISSLRHMTAEEEPHVSNTPLAYVVRDGMTDHILIAVADSRHYE